MFVMSAVPVASQVLLFNSLLHGIDVTSILRSSMPVMEMAVGLVETFILAWLVGASVAGVYNVSARR